jgi:hypothetical protein
MHDRIPIATTPTERRIRREAHSAALRDRALALRQTGATYAAIGGVLGVSLERARQIVRKAERLAFDPRWHDELPARALNFLRSHELDGLPEHEAAIAVARLTRRELMRAPNFGAGACAAVVAWLARRGLKLQPESPRAFSQRLISERPIETGTPARRCPSDDSNLGPFAADRNEVERQCLYLPPRP